jgi:hypothetical protein
LFPLSAFTISAFRPSFLLVNFLGREYQQRNLIKIMTSAIKQDGTNQVNIIASTAEQQAAIEFAKAAAMRPQIVGLALKKISQDPDISHALFAVLETQNIIAGEANITLIPRNSELLGQLVAATQTTKAVGK